MAAGLKVDKDTLDHRVGTLAWQLRDFLEQAQTVKVWLDGKSVQDLQTLGYSEEDATTLKSAFTDLDKLARIAHGQADQDEPNDFFFWANRLTGVQ